MKLTTLKVLPSGEEDGFWAVAWAQGSSSDKSLLITGSLDESVRIWEGDELEAVRTSNSGGSLGIVSIAVDPTGYICAASSMDSKVRVFEVSSNSLKKIIDCSPAESWSVAYDPKGRFLAVAGGMSNSVKLYDCNSWQLHCSLDLVPNQKQKEDKSLLFVLSVAWSSDGSLVACGCMDGTVTVFDVASRRCLHVLEGHHRAVRSLIFSRLDNRVLFTASDDCNINMYDAVGRTLISCFTGHSDAVLTVDSSPDGSAIASGSGDKTVRLWDVSMRSSVQTVSDHEDKVWSVAFKPQFPAPEGAGSGKGSHRVASAGEDGRIALYEFS